MPTRITLTKVIIYVTLFLTSTALFLYIYSIKHYPIWWWFLPYERKLCDHAPINFGFHYHLQCYYVIRHNIIRYEIEELHTNPNLVIIHRLGFNKFELNKILNDTREFSEQSPVYNLITDSEYEREFLNALDFRTSRSYEIDDSELPSIYRKAELASGLNASNLDGWFNILWYRKYGHIIPHHDVYPYSDSVTEGRRFATLIVYLFEPENGGATIFPKLGIAVQPKVDDAILFYNTEVNNEPDPLLTHAGCPVWQGEKFIGTF